MAAIFPGGGRTRRPVWTRMNALTYLGQVSLRGSRDNALASLADIHRTRQPMTPLSTALMSPRPERSQREHAPVGR